MSSQPAWPPQDGAGWWSAAQCRREHAAYFFPPAHHESREEKSAREDEARAICAACPVVAPCLDFAIQVQEPHGIWGGLNELERRRVARRRRYGPLIA